MKHKTQNTLVLALIYLAIAAAGLIGEHRRDVVVGVLVLMLLTFGIGIAMGTVSLTWMTNYFFSRQLYSKRFGAVQFTNSLGIAVGIPLIATLLERVPKFNWIWLIVASLSLLMLILLMVSIHGNLRSREEAA